MMGQLSLLNMACAAKARLRTLTLTRATREEMLCFSILGGLERGHGIYVTKVTPDSKAAEAGLKRGDQVFTFFLAPIDGWDSLFIVHFYGYLFFKKLNF